MSVRENAVHANSRRQRDVRRLHPRGWKLWAVPRPFLVLVLAIDLAALAVIGLTATVFPVTDDSLMWFAVLVGLSVVHLEANRGIEQMRELATEGRTYVDLKSIWSFAGLLLLPPPLVAALIVVTYGHSWFRVGRDILPHRWVFSAATVVLGSAAGGLVLALANSGDYPGSLVGWAGVGVVAAAAVARWAGNSLLVFIAMPLMDTGTTWRRALRMVFGTPGDDLEEFAALSLGAGVAALLTLDAAWLLAFGVPLLLLHRGLQLRKFEFAARVDADTGALKAPVWRELAAKQLERAHRKDVPVGYLLIRIDGFDALVARHAAAGGRQAMHTVSGVVSSVVRDGDLVGRLPGAELVVLLAEVGSVEELRRIAHRIRDAVADTTRADADDDPAGLTVSIGAAQFPVHATTLDDLMLRAYGALWLAKAYIGGQVRVVGGSPTVPNGRLP
jgi:diguanylate cyclase (GGDEF)-like protein